MPIIIMVLVIAAVISIILAIRLGPVSIAPGSVIRIIASRIPFFKKYILPTWTVVDENIVWGLRFPRVLLEMIVGASLSVTGVAMQSLAMNHLYNSING